MKIHQSFALLTLGLAPGLLFCAGRALAQNVPEVVPHVVVVQFEPGIYLPGKTTTTGLQVFDRQAAVYEVHTIERMYPFLDQAEPTPETRSNLMALRRTYYARYDADVIPERVSRDLALAPGIVYAEPVPLSRIRGPVRWERIDPNDPFFNNQTELRALKLPEAWDVVKGSYGTPKVVIAIVDGGGEWRHEDLRANVWTNEDEIPGNGIDDDSNGFIDDVHGVNFANGDVTDNDPTGLPHTPGNAQHGTAAAGSASAVTDNFLGVAGAAWNAELMHINAGSPHFDRLIPSGYQGILYAAMNGADIINASWGGLWRGDQAVRHIDQTLNLATDMGALIVAAAGNRDYNIDVFRDYPPRHPRVLSVGATQKDTRLRAGFSNYGRLVNVFAPGVDITTTGSDNGYIGITGTSFSSPLVAGVAALVKTQFPGLSPDALREHVRLASENIDTENPGFAGHLGRGFVNALAAVQTPTVPAIRLRHWSWEDHDGDRIIEPSERVTITMTVVNHLADANQLRVELVGAEPYSSVQWTTPEVEIGHLAGGDSTEVVFEFTVAPNAPADQQIRLFTHVHDGAFEDVADLISFRVNRQLERVHLGLSAFYAATDGDNWTKNDNWDVTAVPTEEELADWFGVSLSEGLLVELFMEQNNLRGALPPELANLQNLQFLSLFENEGLMGTIPPELGNLEQLQVLDLSRNSLSGPIPPKLGNLEQLQRLSLSDNSLTGPVPPELGNLEQLQRLSLSYNSLSGPVPPELGNLEQLQTLWIYNNALSGSIPNELGNLGQLQFLGLGGNSLSGPIPSELGNLEFLQDLLLFRNSLSGPIPSELGNLGNLKRLWLDGNPFSGQIPPELGNLEQLQMLSLADNSLSGPISPELGNLRQLRSLILSDNSLSGPIPPDLGNLEQLRTLWLSNNSLSGPIPPELGNLARLERLSLSGNDFAGQLPRSLMQLDNLELFHFDNQNLCAPADDEFQTWLNSIPNHSGSTCIALHFASTISDQSFLRTVPITPLILPEARGGILPITYSLTPTLLAGLAYDSSTRTISGAPTVVTFSPIPYTFKATDATGAADSLVFSIEVSSPVAVEREGLPESFTVYDNYPNPFRESTLLVVDLPWPATLNVEVFDVTGRRVLSQPPVNLAAGRRQSIRLEGSALPSGLYLYRIQAESPVGIQRQAGRFLRMR